MLSFSELEISPHTKERLAPAGFVTATPVQAATIPHALAGRDVLATAATGTGKTLAFLIPIVERILREKTPGITALVLTPTRELAMQIAEHYQVLRGSKLGPAALVVGGLSEGAQLAALRRGARLVVATPGRLEDFLTRKAVDFRALRILVLDEADRMLDDKFFPAIRRIASRLPAQRQTLCFSATLEGKVARLVNEQMNSPVRIELGSTLKPSANVRLQAFEVVPERKTELLRRLLAAEAGPCLVFTRTKRGADRLAKNLEVNGLETAAIHGDRSQSQRNRALAGFQQGRYRVLVATDVASRGIHVDGIAQVVNYDLPDIAENFVHRVGRTGRAGRTGVASTLFTPSERGEVRQLERALGIRMENPSCDTLPHAKERTAPRRTERRNPALSFNITPLPGEILQAQY